MSKSSLRWAFLFPGQGAQYPAMGRDFYEAFSVARQTFEEADELLNTHFSRTIFQAPASELTETKTAQVAIFIVSLAILRTVREQFPIIAPFVCAGLSLGEYTALVAAEKITFSDALKLVRVRALAMQDACMQKEGQMYVVLGLSEESVAQTIASLHPHPLWIANLNCPEQVVIAGAQESMPLAIEALKKQGAKRTLALDVSGPFHSGFMRSAQEILAPKIAQTQFTSSPVEIVMNVPGGFVRDLDEMRRYLFEQVVSSVRWEKGIRAIMDQSIDIYLEMGPGKTLNGMNKRIGVNVPTISIEKISDLDELAKQMEKYAITQC